ncbi:MAG: Hsp20/alpha crystallin family protein [bacterium]|nr:Hsp20/alpha crystallin family protein [bacterium]
MASFFEKLKKGMGIEESKLSSPPFADAREVEEPMGWTEEEKEAAETPIETKTNKKPKKLKESQGENKTPELKIKKLEIQTKTLVEEDKSSSSPFAVVREAEKEPKEQKEKKWPFFGKEEGQLAIDVYQTENDLVIQSAIAGVTPENLDILMERDIITIKGSREKPSEENGDYFTQECFWGPFSREVILPAEVDPGRAIAEMKNGILTIRIPKILREKKRKIIIRG